jgi:hypothetical protein
MRSRVPGDKDRTTSRPLTNTTRNSSNEKTDDNINSVLLISDRHETAKRTTNVPTFGIHRQGSGLEGGADKICTHSCSNNASRETVGIQTPKARLDPQRRSGVNPDFGSARCLGENTAIGHSNLCRPVCADTNVEMNLSLTRRRAEADA